MVRPNPQQPRAKGRVTQPAAPRPKPRPKRRIRLRKRWLLLAMPFVVFGGLIALAPVAPERSELQEQAVRSAQQRGRDAKPFRYIPDDEVYGVLREFPRPGGLIVNPLNCRPIVISIKVLSENPQA